MEEDEDGTKRIREVVINALECSINICRAFSLFSSRHVCQIATITPKIVEIVHHHHHHLKNAPSFIFFPFLSYVVFNPPFLLSSLFCQI